jgi:hypothetical protein
LSRLVLCRVVVSCALLFCLVLQCPALSLSFISETHPILRHALLFQTINRLLQFSEKVPKYGMLPK